MRGCSNSGTESKALSIVAKSHNSASWSLCCITQRVPGAWSQDAAHTVVHNLYGRLAPGCPPVLSSDGVNLYFYALTAHFGEWVARARGAPVASSPAADLWASQEARAASTPGVGKLSDALRA